MMNNNDGNAPAHQYLDDERFQQTLTLPPNASRPAEFKVTYADFGHRNEARVLLFCGPLVGR
jgi:hypothetical protein